MPADELLLLQLREPVERWSRSPLPDLPPEIWTIIFTLATRPTGLLDTSPPIPGAREPRRLDWLHRYRTYRYGDSTKRALILVSKLWWSLSINLFYEKICIRSSFELLGLVQALESNISRAAGTSAVSTYIKHVTMDLNPFLGNDGEANAFKKLFSICKCIQVLRVRNTSSFNVPLITPRRDALKCLCVVWDDNEQPYCAPLIKSLNHSSNLQVLEIFFDYRTAGPKGTSLSEPLSFPSLHTLGLSFTYSKYCDIFIADIANWELPSLVSVELHLAEYQQREFLEQFFTLHGPKLTSIGIHNMNFPVLLLIAKRCTILEDLIVLYYIPQDQFTHAEASFPQLRRIRLEKDMYFSAAKQFLQGVFSIRKPSLRKIQVGKFMDNFTSDVHDQVKKMVDDWGKENVRLEDEEGQLLDVSVKAHLTYAESKMNLGA
jgi:hypothetical protein